MPENVQSTPPEKLRLLRLRSELETAELAIANALLELHVSDTFTIAVSAAANEIKRARILVVGSLQAFDEDDVEAVK